MSESRPLHQNRGQCVTFAQGHRNTMELTAVLGRQSHSPTVSVPQDHLPLNLTLKICFTL